jgi:hypothetical protein
MEVIAHSIRDGGKGLSEPKACLIADARIRATAENLQKAGIPGDFSGVKPAQYVQNDPATVYAAFRRGKRAMGFAKLRQTKK